MTIASDLFAEHRHIVLARIGLHKILGRRMGDSPFRASETAAVRAACISAEKTSARILEAARLAEGTRGVIPFRQRRGR